MEISLNEEEIPAHLRRYFETARVPSPRAKDLCLVPSRLAFALQSAGWYVRCDIIWAKANPMPESVTDRPTKAHEYVLMFTKSERYFYDHVAVMEPLCRPDENNASFGGVKHVSGQTENRKYSGNSYDASTLSGRNRRSVWQINTRPCSDAHFAVMPPALVEPCLLAATSQKGCCSECGAPWKRVTETPQFDKEQRARPGDDGGKIGYGRPGVNTMGSGQVYQDWRDANPAQTVGWEPTCKCADAVVQPCRCLDPFGGSGTVSLVAAEHGRDCTLIDLVPHNMEIIAVNRLKRVQPRLALEA